MVDSEWFPVSYPVVPGHEVVGTIVAAGPHVKGRTLGQRVGLGWHSSSCQHCAYCLGGEQNLCPTRQPTIVGRHGGFADKVRAHWSWALPLPEGLDPASAGQLRRVTSPARWRCNSVPINPKIHRVTLNPDFHF